MAVLGGKFVTMSVAISLGFFCASLLSVIAILQAKSPCSLVFGIVICHDGVISAGKIFCAFKVLIACIKRSESISFMVDCL